MPRDDIYRTLKTPLESFAFDTRVAEVFDDMIHRSVPLYTEIIRRQAQMIERDYQTGTRIYDLGCSTGNLAMALCARMPAGAFDMVAVDASQPMLDILATRLDAAGRTADIRLMCDDVRHVDLVQAGVVVVNFTLQFTAPSDRDALLQRISVSLVPGGRLFLSEKTVHPHEVIADLEVDFHHRFKRDHGYSELEISQKRDALDNVLVPDTEEIHRERLRRCRFSHVSRWLKWFNFSSWICIK